MRWALLLVLTGFAAAQGDQVTFANLDDSLTGWQYNPPCQGAVCAGGAGLPTFTSLVVGIPAPAMDGTSARFTLTAPPLNGPSLTTNVLWPRKVGANNAYTTFVGTYHVYLPEVTNVAALEFDQFQFNRGQRYMFGSECDRDGEWRTWNQATGSWINTGFPCTLFVANTWHSIVWTTHRVTGNVNMYYDSLTVDGIVYAGFLPQPSAPSSDPDNNGIQFQIDESAAGGLVTAYVDGMSLVLGAAMVAPVMAQPIVQ